MRSIVCRYETAELLAEALASPDRELPVIRRPRGSDAPPESSSSFFRGAVDGEWVLAIVEVLGHASAAAARVRKHGDSIALVFEPRDWTRLEKLRIEAPETDRNPGIVKKSSMAPKSVMKKLGDARGARILLVDDDTEVRDVVTAMLEAVGFAITAARTGEEGLGMLERGKFDLVVLDWTLPGMSGLDLCRAVRARWSKLPVLFLTANAGTRDVVDAFAGGADDYVVKPFRAPELGARIFGLLRRSSSAT